MSETVWVSTTSHRSRDRLRRLAGDPGPEYGIWPTNDLPHGSYYQVPARLASSAAKIPGARVLRGAPTGGRLFRRLTSAEMGTPPRGAWPVPENSQ
jgi:hypothetical protein